MSGASAIAVLSLQATLNDVYEDTLCDARWDIATKETITRANEVIELISEDYFNKPPRITIDDYGSVWFEWLLYDKDTDFIIIVSIDDYKIVYDNWHTHECREAVFKEKERITQYLKLLDD